MEKLAPTDHPIHELLARRWSPRAFASTMPDKAVLASLIEAARWAPSSYNEQPWRFLITQRGDNTPYRLLLDCLSPGNRGWGQAAPILLLVAANTRRARDGEPNLHAWYDTGQAMACLTVQASAMNLVMHQMSGFDRAQAAETLELPEGIQPIAVVAVGYAGNIADLPEDIQKRERSERIRKFQTDFLLEQSLLLE